MSVNYDLNKMKRLIEGRFDNLGVHLDKSEIDGDFFRYSVSITVKSLDKAAVAIHGTIGNHGYANIEAVFDEYKVSADSLIAVNSFNDKYDLVKACISRRGHGRYFLVLSRSVQYMPTEECMAALAMEIIDDFVDDDHEEDMKKLLRYLA
ncbi:MAG: hypothetical protein SPI58_01295 [Candidatus Enteromonas sp.]|nr:hypothetical protein [Candidatus Enteromonas sp.]MDY6093659.1 hypothetical protein [Candidatus Enteromonas sp.]